MEPKITLHPAVVKQHFKHHLDRVYNGKKYLQKHLPGLIEFSSFKKLQQSIREVADDVNNQIVRIEEVYRLLDIKPGTESCTPIISVYKDAFEPLERNDSNQLLNDIDIILYMQLLEQINITSYRMLRVLSTDLQQPKVEQLLVESFDEALDDNKLFVLIADEYLNNSQAV